MQLGSLSGNDLLLHADDFDNLEFHSTSDDEDFVVVDCRAQTQRSFSDPGSTFNSTTRVVPETSRTMSQVNAPSSDSSGVGQPTNNIASEELDDFTDVSGHTIMSDFEDLSNL